MVLLLLPVVGSYVNLISGTTHQLLQSVLFHIGRHLHVLPLPKLRFVVYGVAMDGFHVVFVRLQLDGQRIGGGGGEGDLRCVRGSVDDELMRD